VKKKITLNEVFNMNEAGPVNDVQLDLVWWKVIREILDLGQDKEKAGVDDNMFNKMNDAWDTIDVKVTEYIRDSGELPDVDYNNWETNLGDYHPHGEEAYVNITPDEKEAIMTAFKVAPKLKGAFYADDNAIKQAEAAFMKEIGSSSMFGG